MCLFHQISAAHAPVEMGTTLHEAVNAALLHRPRVKRVDHRRQSTDYAPPGPPQLKWAHEGHVLERAVLKGGLRCCARAPNLRRRRAETHVKTKE